MKRFYLIASSDLHSLFVHVAKKHWAMKFARQLRKNRRKKLTDTGDSSISRG